MRFIDALLGFSPDNNSGATEAGILLVLGFGIIAFWHFTAQFKKRTSQRARF